MLDGGVGGVGGVFMGEADADVAVDVVDSCGFTTLIQRTGETVQKPPEPRTRLVTPTSSDLSIGTTSSGALVRVEPVCSLLRSAIVGTLKKRYE